MFNFWQVRSLGSSMGFHWDKDERLRGRTGEYIFPYLSTITYLSTGGGPTVILDSMVDTSGAPLVDAARTAPTIGIPIDTGWVSYPELGKHVCFDGRLLHGVPAEFAPPTTEAGSLQQRITFLVNIWTNHKPESSLEYPLGARGTAQPRPLPLLFLPHRLAIPEMATSPNWPFASFPLRSVQVCLELPHDLYSHAKINHLQCDQLRQLFLQDVFCGDEGEKLRATLGCPISALAQQSADAISAALTSSPSQFPTSIPITGVVATEPSLAFQVRLELCVRLAMPREGLLLTTTPAPGRTTWRIHYRGTPDSMSADPDSVVRACLCLRVAAKLDIA
jgi:hypothetical protein